ncbi:fibronectin type III domain-containing protein [Virgibacillus sp. CM-4]|uniref:fibronectin type III domain-containing protein n=1 Tax=Virgibacillus sp. CM-4 TaxID=1354277 RepID=UPI00059DFF6C|nr:fibronectin type III domain-containing protein [Virgibacillus sp. CM-4]
MLVNHNTQRLLPKAPTSLVASNETDTSVDLNWNVAEGASGYNVYQDGAKIDTVTTNSYSVSGLTTATTYEFYVTAINDKHGTESEPSTVVNVTTL